MDTFHFLETKRHQELDICSSIRIVSQLIMIVITIVVITESQCLMPFQANFLPLLKPGLRETAFHRLSDASGSRNGRRSGISLSGVRQRGRNGKYPRPFGRSPTPGRCPRNPLRSATPPRSANVCPAPPPGRQGSAQGSQG